MDTLTIVVPWFGADTAGGAETQARQLAAAIHALGVPVEVWASDGRDSFAPPLPHYPEGLDTLDGVAVRRFAITPPASEPRVPPAVLRRGLLRELPVFPDHELRLLASLVSSDALLEAVATECPNRQFLFVLYPFPTSFWGTLLAGERAHLLPCLHDEPYARYSTYRWMFGRARRILSNSPAERRLALQLYGLPEQQAVVAGEGIKLDSRGDGAAFRARRGLAGPLLMWAGRRDASKNFPLLVAYVREYWARRGRSLRLLVGGRDPLDLPPALDQLVLDLGYIGDQEKADAYAAADVFVHPSTYESFSIVLMEAWLQGTPALVNANCAVTREAVHASGGGLSFGSFAEFAAALDLLLADQALRQQLGAQGRDFVLRTCRWDEVARATVTAIYVDAGLAPANPDAETIARRGA
ncbi:MAG: glycosyltransferase family 4 protein [Roseiflexaceae bacterium]|nr:glycosyltransferase family 4 protein [Roseiflexaceae bacterium]